MDFKVDHGPYLTRILTEGERVILDRKLSALMTITGCADVMNDVLQNDYTLDIAWSYVRMCTRRAIEEDKPGVWRRRGAGSWSHVLSIISALGEKTPRRIDGKSTCTAQVNHAIYEVMCDAVIADLAGETRGIGGE